MPVSLKGWRTTRSNARNTFCLEDGGTNIRPDRHLYRCLLQQRHFVRFLMYTHPASTQSDARHVASHTDVAVAAATGGGSPVEMWWAVRCQGDGLWLVLTGVSSAVKLPRCVHRQSQDNTVTLLPGGQCPLTVASVHSLCKQNGALRT